jgi:hypothetical protein
MYCLSLSPTINFLSPLSLPLYHVTACTACHVGVIILLVFIFTVILSSRTLSPCVCGHLNYGFLAACTHVQRVEAGIAKYYRDILSREL